MINDKLMFFDYEIMNSLFGLKIVVEMDEVGE